MAIRSKENNHPAEEEFQALGLYCDEDTLKKIDFIAAHLHWSRSTLIIESIKHVLNLIERYDNKIIPDFVIQARALQKAGRCDFNVIQEPISNPNESVKVRTGCSLPPFLLKKISHISDVMGYSRNSFISLCLIHAINIVRDEKADPFPNIVKIARVCTSRSIDLKATKTQK